MSKTVTKTATEKEIERAHETLLVYAELQKEKASIDANMKAAKADLEKFAKKYRNKFSENKNFHFGEDGYLHYAEKTEIITDEKKFNFKEFIRKFPLLVETKFKLSEIKKAMLSGDTRKPLEAAGIDLDVKEEFSIVINK